MIWSGDDLAGADLAGADLAGADVEGLFHHVAVFYMYFKVTCSVKYCIESVKNWGN